MDDRINPEDYLYLIDEVLRVRKYRRLLAALHIEHDDAYQICAIGLIKAVTAYDPERGTFPAIAHLMIKTELFRYTRKFNSVQGKHGAALSLDVPLSSDTGVTYMDLIADTHTGSDYDNALLAVMVDELNSRLNTRERNILQCIYHHGLDGPRERSMIRQKVSVSEKQFYTSIAKLRKAVQQIFFERRQAATC